MNPESINNKCLNLICQFDNCISARPDASRPLNLDSEFLSPAPATVACQARAAGHLKTGHELLIWAAIGSTPVWFHV